MPGVGYSRLLTSVPVEELVMTFENKGLSLEFCCTTRIAFRIAFSAADRDVFSQNSASSRSSPFIAALGTLHQK